MARSVFWLEFPRFSSMGCIRKLSSDLHPPENEEELRQNMFDTANAIRASVNLLKEVNYSISKRVEICIQEDLEQCL